MTPSNRSSFTVCATALVIAATSAAYGQVWQASADFSPTQNPNGAWQYGWTQSLGSAFNLMPYTTTQFCGTPTWHAPQVSTYLVIQKNHMSTPLTCGTGTYPPFGLIIHPGPNNERSVLRWTAPAAGSCSISASFPGVSFGPSSDVAVLHNGVVLGSGLVTTFAAGPSYFFTVAAQPGDTIDFLVGFGTNASYVGDATGLFATVALDVGTMGPGCGSSPPVLAVTPVALGASVTLSISNAAASTTGLLFASALATGPLQIGAGCAVYLDLGTLIELAAFTTSPAGDWSLTVTAPSDPLLVGAQFALQSILLPTAGPLGFDLSNGLLITVAP
jgi:hypothetical protein